MISSRRNTWGAHHQAVHGGDIGYVGGIGYVGNIGNGIVYIVDDFGSSTTMLVREHNPRLCSTRVTILLYSLIYIVIAQILGLVISIEKNFVFSASIPNSGIRAVYT